MKKTILILVSFLVLSCSSNNDEPVVTPFEPVTITPILISKRFTINPSVGIAQQNSIIINISEWNVLIDQINNYYQPFGVDFIQNHFLESTIDFNNFIVLAVFDKPYSNGGHSIDITNIIEFETNIVVTVEKLQTGNTSSSGTQPYHIVKIPITTKPIVFNML